MSGISSNHQGKPPNDRHQQCRLPTCGHFSDSFSEPADTNPPTFHQQWHTPTAHQDPDRSSTSGVVTEDRTLQELQTNTIHAHDLLVIIPRKKEIQHYFIKAAKTATEEAVEAVEASAIFPSRPTTGGLTLAKSQTSTQIQPGEIIVIDSSSEDENQEKSKPNSRNEAPKVNYYGSQKYVWLDLRPNASNNNHDTIVVAPHSPRTGPREISNASKSFKSRSSDSDDDDDDDESPRISKRGPAARLRQPLFLRSRSISLSDPKLILDPRRVSPEPDSLSPSPLHEETETETEKHRSSVVTAEDPTENLRKRISLTNHALSAHIPLLERSDNPNHYTYLIICEGCYTPSLDAKHWTPATHAQTLEQLKELAVIEDKHEESQRQVLATIMRDRKIQAQARTVKKGQGKSLQDHQQQCFMTEEESDNEYLQVWLRKRMEKQLQMRRPTRRGNNEPTLTPAPTPMDGNGDFDMEMDVDIGMD